ncbi:hypothetical protein JYU34_008141 [Plutella xylostella]|uniref:Uncharacterized protein n=1 Tax=Plutella xylostella TaxID=51655 RepID=A0ABQ7QNU8_PLUXY|nr:hypothetical protein JYU34_008141 [Plutella xylostella]
METTLKDLLQEFQQLISKMPMEVCCVTVLAELGLQWKAVTQAVRNARLPMTSASVAKILTRHVSRSLEAEELSEIVAQLRIKLIATSSSCTWHAITLSEPVSEEEPVAEWCRLVGHRAQLAARRTVKKINTRVEVHTAKFNDFLFLSLRSVSAGRGGRGGAARGALCVCAAPAQPVAFVTTLASRALLQAAVEGLGYRKYTNADLNGRDLQSLLRIVDRTWNTQPQQLTEMPEYDPQPVVTENGIDFTNRAYNAQYVESIIGADPPLLNSLEIKSERPYAHPSRLKKNIAIGFSLKTENLAETLKHWVGVMAIPPTSDFVKIFHELKSNRITYHRDDMED